MLKVAVLDDYQNVTKKFGNWSELDGKINLKIFNKYFNNSVELVKCLSNFDVLCLMRERTILRSSVINKLPELKLVITTGMWNPSVDINALNKRKVVFCGTENRIESTAELSWLLTQVVWRNISQEFLNMKNGNWQTSIGRTLYGKTLGIFGLGKQGKQVARFGNAFGMNVIAWSHNLTKEICDLEKVTLVSSDEMFKISDVLSIHTKLSERTRGYVDKKKLKLMKKSSVLVNTSRGPIINEQDLINALNKGIISCAALDVYDQEPLPKDHILRKTKNTILTPHIGYVSSEAYEKFFSGYLLAIEAFINKSPINQIN